MLPVPPAGAGVPDSPRPLTVKRRAGAGAVARRLLPRSAWRRRVPGSRSGAPPHSPFRRRCRDARPCTDPTSALPPPQRPPGAGVDRPGSRGGGHRGSDPPPAARCLSADGCAVRRGGCAGTRRPPHLRVGTRASPCLRPGLVYAARAPAYPAHIRACPSAPAALGEVAPDAASVCHLGGAARRARVRDALPDTARGTRDHRLRPASRSHQTGRTRRSVPASPASTPGAPEADRRPRRIRSRDARPPHPQIARRLVRRAGGHHRRRPRGLRRRRVAHRRVRQRGVPLQLGGAAPRSSTRSSGRRARVHDVPPHRGRHPLAS
jgi:hypothetical protein